MTDDATAQPQVPQPDPALKRLDFLVGKWSLRGHLVGADEENITGEASYEWLPGGFFLRQRVKLDFAGFVNIDSEELIGYDPETKTFKSYVFSNMSPEPLPYEWDVTDGSMTITVSHGLLDATYKGQVSEDGNSLSGGWRPNPGADVELTRFRGHPSAWADRPGQEGCPDATYSSAVSAAVPPGGGGAAALRRCAQAGRR